MADVTNLKVLINIAAKRYCQQVLVLFLREFFQKNDSVPAFMWHSDPAVSKISITSEYPEKLMKVPCVVVGDVTGNPYNRTIGQELITEHKVPKIIDGKTRYVVDKITTHGIYTLECTIDCLSYKVSTRRFVADLVEAAFRHIGINALKPAGITINDVKMLSGSYTPVGNQIFQSSKIKVGMVTEWHKETTDFPTLEKILIKEINISGEVN